MFALNVPPFTGGLIRGARQFNWDVKAAVVGMMRGFPGDQLMERLREQPSAALLHVLHRRLSQLDVERFQRHQDRCDVRYTTPLQNKEPQQGSGARGEQG
jgi:hypothetical protein